MILRAALVWALGLVTLVPYAVHRLLFHAARDEYALLITLALFWVFGFWGVVGPLLGLLKARAVYRVVARAQDGDAILAALRRHDTRDAVVGAIAADNGIPRFVAARVYDRLVAGMADDDRAGVRTPRR